jgi:hypothetical protein
MAVGNFTLVNTGKEALLTDNANQINWASDTIVAVLLGAGYTPSLAHTQYSDVSANVIADAGYAPVVLTGKTSVLSAGKILWDCADVSFGTNVSLTAKYVAFFKRAGGSLTGTDQYIGYGDLNDTNTSATVSSTNSTFAVNTTNGLFDV